MFIALLSVLRAPTVVGVAGLACLAGGVVVLKRRRGEWGHALAMLGGLAAIIGVIDLVIQAVGGPMDTRQMFHVALGLGILLVFMMGYLLTFTDDKCRKWRSRDRLTRPGKVDYARQQRHETSIWDSPVVDVAAVAGLFLVPLVTPVTTGNFLVDWLLVVALSVLVLNRRSLIHLVSAGGRTARRGRRAGTLGGRKTRRVFE